MAASEERQVVSILNRLIRLCIASEKGFNVSAENVKNRGLQVMFKSYAQERAQFARVLRDMVVERGGEAAEGGGMLAAAHRGWINIKAAMTIGQPATETVVLGEAVRGERVAVRRYEEALQQQSLPEGVMEVIEEQYRRLEEVSERVQDLQGRQGRRLVVRLFDSESDADVAEEQLAAASFEGAQIERVPLDQVLTLYEGEHVADTTLETSLAGALVGAGVGILLGLIAGISTMVVPGGSMFALSLAETFLWTILLGAVTGLFFGALIGAIIGLGLSQEDEYRYANSVRHGSLLLLLRVDQARANEAAEIMKRVNARRWRLAT
ncbi:MAG: PA2169 family four-helix-bundle protein [Chloroflexota bacterium]